MSTEAERYPAYKRITSAVILILAALWVGYLLLWPMPGSAAPGMGIPVGAPAPDFSLKAVDGQSYRLSDLQGKAVMINFFATWCPPCRAEMPTIQEVYAEFEAQGFVVLAVNLNESDVAIRSFQEALGITFPIVVDREDRVSRLYDVLPLPTSYFVDRQGVVRGKWTGEIRKDQLLSFVAQVL